MNLIWGDRVTGNWESTFISLIGHYWRQNILFCKHETIFRPTLIVQNVIIRRLQIGQTYYPKDVHYLEYKIVIQYNQFLISINLLTFSQTYRY